MLSSYSRRAISVFARSKLGDDLNSRASVSCRPGSSRHQCRGGAKRREVTILSQHSTQSLLKLKVCLCCPRCLLAGNADVADELSLTPSVYAASDGERKALDALQAGEHSALHADLMLVRTDAIVCVQPPPVGSLA